MLSIKRVSAVLVGLLTVACGSASSPVGPMPSPSPTLNPRSIAMGMGMPASGSTLSAGSCARGACTQAISYSFVVRFDAAVQRPVFRVALTRADGKECLAAFQTGLSPVVAGEPHAFSGDTLMFTTTPPDGPATHNNCKVPFSTTRITTELHDGDIAGPVLLAQDFSVTYQWTP